MPSRSSRKIASDIRKQQLSTKNVIPHTSFQRLVTEIIQDSSDDNSSFCVREEAIKALQCESESFLTGVFDRARQLAEYNKRDTVTKDDLKFVLQMQGFSLPECTEHQTPNETMAPCASVNCVDSGSQGYT